MKLIVGEKAPLFGNVTTLVWIAARSPQNVEKSLGYGPGRLSAGYCVALLSKPLEPQDFEFEGTTMRSGGKLGLPSNDPATEHARRRVHQEVMGEYGEDHYETMQKSALRGIPAKGPDRIAKVVPMEPHNEAMGTADQYPVGAGGLQWTLKKPGKDFLIALFVDSNGYAQSTDFAHFIGEGAPYENRAKVMRFLCEVDA